MRINLSMKILAIMALLLLAIYLLLPSMLLKTVNRRLAELPDYRGSIQALELGFIPLSVSASGLEFKHRQTGLPAITAQRIQIKPHWPLFYHGALLVTAVVEQPKITLLAKKSQAVKLPTGKDEVVEQRRWPIMVQDIVIKQGIAQFYRYRNDAQPIFAIWKINARISNLVGKPNKNPALLPSNLELSGVSYGNAPLRLHIAFNPVAAQPTFDLDGELKQLALAELNPMLRNHTGIRVKQGYLSLYVEAAAAKGKITGYVKPLLQGLQVREPEKTRFAGLDQLYQKAVQEVNRVLKNENTQAAATRIPIRGNIRDPQANLWSIILELLRNAFIQALLPRVDNSINVQDVLEFF